MMADIVFAPLCSLCGSLLLDEIGEIEEFEPSFLSGIYFQNMELRPTICPTCSAVFSSVIMPKRLPVRVNVLDDQLFMEGTDDFDHQRSLKLNLWSQRASLRRKVGKVKI